MRLMSSADALISDFLMTGFSAVDVFADERIATLASILQDLATDTLDSVGADSALPLSMFRYLCTRHPRFTNYPKVLDLKTERTTLEQQLSALRLEIRQVLASQHSNRDEVDVIV